MVHDNTIEALQSNIEIGFEDFIPLKINGHTNVNYWYDLNQEFKNSVYQDGLKLSWFLDHTDFLKDFCCDIEHLGISIIKTFIEVQAFTKETNQIKKASIKTRFNTALSEFEQKKKELYRLIFRIEGIRLENEETSLKIKDFCSFHLVIFYEFLSALGLNIERHPIFQIDLKQDLNAPKHNINQSTTAAQYALYHCFLQDSNVKPHFKEKVREIKSVVKEYGVSWKNFQTHYNLILTKKTQIKEKDLLAVQRLLYENHPELLNKFLEDYSNI